MRRYVDLHDTATPSKATGDAGMSSRPYRWVTMCMLLCLALRLFRIGHQNLWIDEMISHQLATYTEGAEFWRGLLRDIHGPLTSALLHGWVRLGSSEAWMRSLYTIPALLTIPVMYELGRVLFHERGARVASLALAVSPFHVWYSQEIRSYTWAILWITIASWLFVRLWDGDKSRGTWLKLGAVLLAGVLTNYAVAFLVVCLGSSCSSAGPSHESSSSPGPRLWASSVSPSFPGSSTGSKD